MALTEIQLPTKAEFFQNIQHAANEMDRLINRWKQIAEFVANVETVDLDAMGVAAGQVRTDLIEFRTVLDEAISFYEGNPVTPTNNPAAVIDKIRSM